MRRMIRTALIATLLLTGGVAVGAENLGKLVAAPTRTLTVTTASQTAIAANTQRHGWCIYNQASSAASLFWATASNGGPVGVLVVTTANGEEFGASAGFCEDGSNGWIYTGPVKVIKAVGAGTVKASTREW
jgi:hypothetical protein